MDENFFSLEVITPDKTLFSDKVTQLIVPGQSGRFGILKNHAPFVSLIQTGELLITLQNLQQKSLQLNGGIFKVEHNTAIITTE